MAGVHNHGPDEEPGTLCPEINLENGMIVGECLRGIDVPDGDQMMFVASLQYLSRNIFDVWPDVDEDYQGS